MTEHELRDALTPDQVLILTLWGEARGEPVEGQIAVGNVIRNRSKHPNPTRFGGSIKDVCLKPAQFSCWWGDDANSRELYRLGEVLCRNEPMPRLYQALFRQLDWITVGILSGALLDNTIQSDHYLTRKLYESEHPPAWARRQIPRVNIGRHVFFQLG